MRQLIALLVFIAVPALVRSQSTGVKPVEIRGHYIGESTVRFLHLESDAREEVEVCRQHPTASFCERLLAAIERGERAEISASVRPDLDHPDAASDTINFVLDGKKLVKLTMLVTDISDVGKILGPPSSESVTPSHNSSGENWVNRLTVWDAADVYATLYQDNNPLLQDRRPVFVIESREEHAREDADSAKAAKSASTN